MRYVVWVLILIALIIPVRPLFGDGLIELQLPFTVTNEGRAPSAVASSTDSAGTFASNVEAAYTPVVAEQGLLVQAASSDSALGASSASSLQALSGIEVLALVWATVALAILLYHAGKYVRFFRLVGRWGRPVEDEDILALLQEVKSERGIAHKKIALKKCGFLSTSMIAGFFRPVILLPEKDFSACELEMIFHHELVHYTRGDLCVKLLSVLALSLNWFNPAVYVMNLVMQADCEASCDQSVIASVGNESKHFYAETIMEMIGYKSASKTALSTCFYGNKQGIKTRMEAIMNTPDNSKKIAIVTLLASATTLVLVVGLAVFAGSVFVLSGQAPPNSKSIADIDPAGRMVAYFDVDDIDIDPLESFITFSQGEDGKEELILRMDDGRDVRISLNEHGFFSVLDGGVIHSTIPSYPVEDPNISSDQAIEIALEDLSDRNIIARLDGSDSGWGEGVEISWEFDRMWLWVMNFYVQNGDKPFIRYWICAETGDIIQHEWWTGEALG